MRNLFYIIASILLLGANTGCESRELGNYWFMDSYCGSSDGYIIRSSNNGIAVFKGTRPNSIAGPDGRMRYVVNSDTLEQTHPVMLIDDSGAYAILDYDYNFDQFNSIKTQFDDAHNFHVENSDSSMEQSVILEILQNVYGQEIVSEINNFHQK